MTAHAMKGDRERCLEAGTDGYVSKPIQPAELWQAIGRLVPDAAPAEPADRVLDPTQVLDRVGGDRKLLRELVEVFLADSPRLRTDIRTAIAGGDAGKLRLAAHALKGAVGTFSAPDATEAAQRLETLGQQGNLTGAEEAAAALEHELERLEPVLAGLARDEP
jgi:HPt (histidine-containing phosphotransfer) domain-containing protein